MALNTAAFDTKPAASSPNSGLDTSAFGAPKKAAPAPTNLLQTNKSAPIDFSAIKMPNQSVRANMSTPFTLSGKAYVPPPETPVVAEPKGKLLQGLDTVIGKTAAVAASGITGAFEPNNIAEKTGETLRTMTQQAAQSIARSFLVTGATFADAGKYDDPIQFLTHLKEAAKNSSFQPTGKIQEAIAGTNEPISFDSIGRETLSILGPDFVKNHPNLAFPVGLTMAGFDMAPFGGEEKGLFSAMKNVKEEGEAIALLSKLGVESDLARFYAPHVVEVKDDAAAKRLLEAIVRKQSETKATGLKPGYMAQKPKVVPPVDVLAHLEETSNASSLKKFDYISRKVPEKEITNGLSDMWFSKGDQPQVDKIKLAMQKGEYMPPVILDRHGNVLDGHHRVEAYRQLGVKDVPALVETGKGTGKIIPHIENPNIVLHEKIPGSSVHASAEEIKSLEKTGREAAGHTDNLPEPKPSAAAEEVLKARDTGFQSAHEIIQEMKTQRDILKDVSADMPGKALAKYESKDYPGQLPEILGKTDAEKARDKARGRKVEKVGKNEAEFNKRGDQIIENALGHKAHGWNTIEEAEKALQDYKDTRAQLKEAKSAVSSRVKNYRDRKAVFDEVVRHVNAEGRTRREKVAAVQDFFNITDDEMKKLTKNERDLRLMSDGEFSDFMKRIEGKATELHFRSQALVDLKSTIFEKELVKTDNLRKVMKLPKIENMSVGQIRFFDETLQQFKQGDEFLGVRQLETVAHTDLAGIKTRREALDRLLADVNKHRAAGGKPLVTREELDAIKVKELDRFRYDTALARRNPLYDLMVQEKNKAFLNADMQVLDAKDKINQLFKTARASRKQSLLDRLIPTDNLVFHWLEATDADKLTVAKEMTGEELDAANYIRESYSEMRDYLVQQQVLKRFRSDYITHVRRGFLEAWKEEGTYVKGDINNTKPGTLQRTRQGLLAAFKEVFKKYIQDEAYFNILDQQTDQVLPLEKFFQYSMKRTGELVPSKNVAKAYTQYLTTFEKKKALDAIVPKLDIYVHSLTPTKMTPRGLEFDASLKKFFKEWMNSKKGRATDRALVKPGGNLDWALRSGVALTRLIDLGLSVPVGIASNLGAQAAVYRGIGAVKYALGEARLFTPAGRTILHKYRAFTGEPLRAKVFAAEGTLGDSLMNSVFGLFSFADRKARQAFLLGNLTPEEMKSGTIALDKLARLKTELGRHLPVEGSESIIGKTALGKVGTQYKSWAVPLLSSSLDDIGKAYRAVKTGDAAFLKSPEFKEIMRTAILSATVGTAFYGLANNKTPTKDQTFSEKVATKAAQDALSLVGALDPSFWTSARLLSFLHNLGLAVKQIVMVERDKNGDLTGPKNLEKAVLPAAIKQLIPAQNPKAGGLNVPNIKIKGIKVKNIKIKNIKVGSAYDRTQVNAEATGEGVDTAERKHTLFEHLANALTPMGATKNARWAKNLSKDAIGSFPFTELAKGELADTKFVPADFKTQGVQGAFYNRNFAISDAAREVVPGVVADFMHQVQEGSTHPTIKVSNDLQSKEQMKKANMTPEDVKLYAQGVIGHEMMHRLFDLSPMGLEPTTDNPNAEKFGMQWLNDWDAISKKYPQLADIDNHLQQSGYDTNDNYSTATERFAYLGQAALEDEDLSLIPPELQKYYKNVIKFN